MLRITLLAVMLLATQAASAFSYTIEVSEKDLQKNISSMMPLEKTQYFFTIILRNPIIQLIGGDNRFGISSDITVKLPGGLQGKGHATIIGNLRYDNVQGAFYIDSPSITKLTISNVPDSYLPDIKSLAQRALSDSLASRPIYRLNDDDLTQKFAKSLLKSVTVKDQKLVLEMDAG